MKDPRQKRGASATEIEAYWQARKAAGQATEPGTTDPPPPQPAKEQPAKEDDEK